MTFPEKLAHLRRERKITQEALAGALGVTRQTVYQWERGVSYPEAMTLFRMSRLFGVTVDFLLDDACETQVTRGQDESRETRADNTAIPEKEKPRGIFGFFRRK